MGLRSDLTTAVERLRRTLHRLDDDIVHLVAAIDEHMEITAEQAEEARARAAPRGLTDGRTPSG